MLLLLASSLISFVVPSCDLYYVSFGGVYAPWGRNERHSNFRGRLGLKNRYCWFLHPQTSCKAKVNQSHYWPVVPRGFQEVKVPRLRDNGPEWW